MDSQSARTLGISRDDMIWLANRLAAEELERTGKATSPIRALSRAVGCSYAAARMWLTGEAVPRRHGMIETLNRLIDERYPRFCLRVTRADLALLELMSGEMRRAMGDHGRELAARIQNEIDRVRSLMVADTPPEEGDVY